jgi:hypothetical protein
MKSITGRLEKLEQREEAKKPVRIFVVGPVDIDYGMCNGVRMSVAEWDAIKTPDCVTIHVGYDKTKENSD